MQPDIQLILSLIFIVGLFLIYKRIKLTRLFYKNSDYNGNVEVFEKYDHELVLTTDSFPQGISTNLPKIKTSYWYQLAQIVLKFIENKSHPQILFLGLGANTSSSLIAKQNPQIKQTVVEIDPVVIEANKKYFNLDQTPNLEVIQDDAFTFLKNTTNIKFDVIVVDIYQGNSATVSEKTTQQDFIKLVIPHLKTDGMLLFNRPAHNSKVKYHNSKLRVDLEKLFKNVEIKFIKDPRRYKNDLMIATQKLTNQI